MFETLSERLGAILDKLTRKGRADARPTSPAMREVRRALLEADVALDVVRDFVDAVTEKAVGQEVVRSITPGQMVVKIVHDELVRDAGSRRVKPHRPRRHAAGGDDDGRPARLGQDHHHRQARQAAEGAREAARC